MAICFGRFCFSGFGFQPRNEVCYNTRTKNITLVIQGLNVMDIEVFIYLFIYLSKITWEFQYLVRGDWLGLFIYFHAVSGIFSVTQWKQHYVHITIIWPDVRTCNVHLTSYPFRILEVLHVNLRVYSFSVKHSGMCRLCHVSKEECFSDLSV
jgi:hypothetical protein